MLDINYVRENPDTVVQDAKDKGVDVDIEKILELDKKKRQAQLEYEKLSAQKNNLAHETKPGEKPTDEILEKGKHIKARLQQAEAEHRALSEELNLQMLLIPNIMHGSVHRGPDEEGNTVIKTVGEKPQFDFEIKDHQEIGEAKDMIDLKSAAEVSGSRFYYLKGDLVLLEQALTSWTMNRLVEKGFIPVIVPTMVREKMMEATGFFPAERNEIYQVNPGEDNLFLAGTSEVPLSGLHIINKLTEDDLPKFYVGYSTCYRREAGSYGKDTKGIFRVHQFNKLEMFCFANPDDSWEIHDKMLAIEEDLLTELGLHYQVINIGSGDLGAPAAKKYDCNVWIPSQGRYRELTSCSNCTDFQARRAGIKYKAKSGSTEFVHTLNGTAMASTRTLIAIMENYQNSDGSITVPKVLRPYINGKETI